MKDAKANSINLINVEYKYNKIFSKISKSSNNYIKNCFNLSLKLIKNNRNKCILINGPISKNSFLNKRFLGITEYLSKKTNSKNEVMLIYNNKLSVSPLTTHIPIKYVTKKISKLKLINNIFLLNKFYISVLKKKVKIAVLGLNPHCETVDNFSEEKKIIRL